jgi:MSHA biogenesis protein MshJ
MSTPSIKRLATTIDALSLRERAMIAAVSLMVLWAAWQTLLMSPMTRERKQLAERTELARSSLQALNASILSLAEQSATDPLAEQRLQLEQLSEQRLQLDRQIANATSSLVDPQQMGEVLEAILARQQGLRTLSLGSLPVEPLGEDSGAGVPPIYRHGIALEVQGEYLEVLKFLRELDALPWEFIWTGLELRVDEEGRRHTRLILHTLSLKRGWLGV